MCRNAADNHGTVYSDLERVAKGTYRPFASDMREPQPMRTANTGGMRAATRMSAWDEGDDAL
jgi:hypothetical protein